MSALEAAVMAGLGRTAYPDAKNGDQKKDSSCCPSLRWITLYKVTRHSSRLDDLEADDVLCLGAFSALANSELDLLAFCQGLEA